MTEQRTVPADHANRNGHAGYEPTFDDIQCNDRPTAPLADPTVDPAEAFWDMRPEFKLIRDHARRQMVSPWGTLGAVLVQVLQTVPPCVKIPAIIATPAGLNMYLGLVGESGLGKGGADGVAAALLDLRKTGAELIGGRLFSTPIGTGEGLVDGFGHMAKPTDPGTGKILRNEPEECVVDRWGVLVEADEIDSLTAQARRPGETTTGMMRTAWLGSKTLGMGYKTSKLLFPPHTYRLGFIGGIAHGEPAADFLNRKSGGLPWRFLFMPAADPGAVDGEVGSPLSQIVLPDMEWPSMKYGQELVLNYPAAVWKEVRAARVAILRRTPGSEPVRGHIMMNRLKVTEGLAVLNGRRHPNEEDWYLAGIVMEESAAIYQEMEDQINASRKRGHVAAGVAKGITDAVAETTRDEQRAQAMGRVLLTKLGTEVWTPRTKAAHWFKSGPDNRGLFDAAVGPLVRAGQIQAQANEGGGMSYRKAVKVNTG